MKKISVTILCMLIAGTLCARTASFSGDSYDIAVNYNDTACPGDAVFVKMNFCQGAKTTKASKKELHGTTARLDFIEDDKTTRSSEFYVLSKDSRNVTLLTGLPLSTWLKMGKKYSLHVTYSIQNEKMEFELPFTLKQKEFVEEILELDSSNTAIKTDTSTKRMEQIKRLNGILETVNKNAIYQTTPFKSPTTSQRKTAFFGDRRTYKYTTGKSSTSLHFGTDYGVPTGSEVTSCAQGKVVLVEDRVSTGWSVVIEHLPGLYSLYYHMSEPKVKTGDNVKQGQLVGLSGATGLATGPHLHWEIRLNMEAVNPDFFVDSFSIEN